MGDSRFVDKTKFVSVTTAFSALFLLLSGLFYFMDRVVFLTQSISSLAPIVSVSHEEVPKGRGSVLAYVPTVQVSDGEGKTINLKVDTYNEENIYTIQNTIYVSCNLQRGCIEDTFLAKWGRILVVFLISLLLFLPLLGWKLGYWGLNGEMVDLRLHSDV